MMAAASTRDSKILLQYILFVDLMIIVASAPLQATQASASALPMQNTGVLRDHLEKLSLAMSPKSYGLARLTVLLAMISTDHDAIHKHSVEVTQHSPPAGARRQVNQFGQPVATYIEEWYFTGQSEYALVELLSEFGCDVSVVGLEMIAWLGHSATFQQLSTLRKHVFDRVSAAYVAQFAVVLERHNSEPPPHGEHKPATPAQTAPEPARTPGDSESTQDQGRAKKTKTTAKCEL